MANSDFIPIEIPPIGEEGFSDRERDSMTSQIARSINFIGKKVDGHDREIYGHKSFPGLKASIFGMNKKIGWLTWATRILMGTAIGEGAGIAYLGVNMLTG